MRRKISARCHGRKGHPNFERWVESHWISEFLHPTIGASGKRVLKTAAPLSREKTMRSKRLLLGVCAGLAVLLLPAATYYVRAQNPAPVALTGQVTSDAEGAMEGVIVSA